MSSIESIVKLLTERTPHVFPTRVWKEELTAQIDALDVPDLVKAALYLWNDDLDRCHSIVQQHEGQTIADHLHAILHRREREFSNARYWYRQISVDHQEVDVYEVGPESDGLRKRQAAEMMQVLDQSRKL